MKNHYTDLFNQSILSVFKQGLRVSLTDPRFTLFFLRTLRRQKTAARIRHRWENSGIQVPPLMIASLTSRCNLHCSGCYAQAHVRKNNHDLNTQEWMGIVREAEDLGVSIVLLAGGEPFMRADVLDITEPFPKMVFPIFTNGLMLTDSIITRLKFQKQVIPVISLEGFEKETDERRGAGVYERLHHVLDQLNQLGIFYGISLTVTRENFDSVTDHAFVRGQFSRGCKLFFFIEYTPVAEETGHLVLSDAQRIQLRSIEEKLHPEFPGMFIVFPGDEDQYGGCLAAGRGFIHVSPEGNLEPCPFAPFSDTNLKQVPLGEALRSRFLEQIRQNHDRLNETRGGCSLWHNRDWVRSLIQPATSTQ